MNPWKLLCLVGQFLWTSRGWPFDMCLCLWDNCNDLWHWDSEWSNDGDHWNSIENVTVDVPTIIQHSQDVTHTYYLLLSYSEINSWNAGHVKKKNIGPITTQHLNIRTLSDIWWYLRIPCTHGTVGADKQHDFLKVHSKFSQDASILKTTPFKTTESIAILCPQRPVEMSCLIAWAPFPISQASENGKSPLLTNATSNRL